MKTTKDELETGRWSGGQWWGEFRTIGSAYRAADGRICIFCDPTDGRVPFLISVGRWLYERENSRIMPQGVTR